MVLKIFLGSKVIGSCNLKFNLLSVLTWSLWRSPALLRISLDFLLCKHDCMIHVYSNKSFIYMLQAVTFLVLSWNEFLVLTNLYREFLLDP